MLPVAYRNCKGTKDTDEIDKFHNDSQEVDHFINRQDRKDSLII
jgi:hypothetical protein